MRAADLAVSRLARRQKRVLTTAQLIAAGLTERAIARRVERGWLHRLHHGVYSVGTPDLPREGRWLAAVFAAGPGAVLSHRDAAALWALLPSSRTRIEVTAPKRRRPRDAIEIHVARLPADEITVVDGIPVTTVARTIFDIAAVEPPRRVERAADTAERRGLAGLLSVADLLARHPRRPGAGTLRELAFDATVTRSAFEEAFRTFLARHGLPRPQMNAWVAGCEVDAYWPHARLVVELDGYEFHRTRGSFEADRLRDRALLLAGIRVVRITWRQLSRAPQRVAADLRALL